MDTVDIVRALDSTITQLTSLRDTLIIPPAPTSIRVTAGSSLQAAIDAAAPYAMLQLEDGVYEGALRVSKPLSFVGMNQLVPGRVTSATRPVTITSAADETILIDSPQPVVFSGIGFGCTNPQGQFVTHVGDGLILDRCAGAGNPVTGLHRAILAHGRNAHALGCWFDDIFSVGRDSCVIGGWDNTSGLVIDGCFLRGGSSTVIFGGADSASADRMPSNIRITRSTLTKRPEWYGKGINLKNALELKAAQHVYVGDCILEYAGTSEGQGAYLIVLNTRNQNGKAPWSAITDVTIERVLAQHGGGCVNFMGTDNNFPSGSLDGVILRNVKFADIDPTGITKGDGRGFFFTRSPKNITLDSITVEGQNLGAVGYFDVPENRPTGLILSNMKVPTTTYGWKIEAGGQGVKALKAYMPDMTFNVTPDDVGAVGYPAESNP